MLVESTQQNSAPLAPHSHTHLCVPAGLAGQAVLLHCLELVHSLGKAVRAPAATQRCRSHATSSTYFIQAVRLSHRRRTHTVPKQPHAKLLEGHRNSSGNQVSVAYCSPACNGSPPLTAVPCQGQHQQEQHTEFPAHSNRQQQQRHRCSCTSHSHLRMMNMCLLMSELLNMSTHSAGCPSRPALHAAQGTPPAQHSTA